jgi:hypothetical protein
MYPYLLSVYGLGAGECNLSNSRNVAGLQTNSIIATTYAMCRMVFVSLPSTLSRSLQREHSNAYSAIS